MCILKENTTLMLNESRAKSAEPTHVTSPQLLGSGISAVQLGAVIFPCAYLFFYHVSRICAVCLH